MPQDVRQPIHYDLKQTEANIRAQFAASGTLPDDAPSHLKAQERGREIVLQQALWAINEGNLETTPDVLIKAMAGLSAAWLMNIEQRFTESDIPRIRSFFLSQLAAMLSPDGEFIERGEAKVASSHGGRA